jgi:hypothetical protein
MQQHRWKWMIGVMTAALLAGCAQTGQGPVKAAVQEPAVPAQVQVPAPPAEKPEAMAVLKNMAEYLSSAGKFSVKVSAGYDVVQDSGQKLEFGEVRETTLVRPNQLRVETTESDGDRNLFIFDGTTISYSHGAQKVYATASAAGTLDDAVKYFVQKLRMRVPLALMYVSNMAEEFEQRVESAAYVEYSTQFDVPCHHVAARTANVDFQVWVAAGREPLPRRVVITYKNEEGEPQFWANFTNWNLSPSVSDAMFVFTPPQGAEKIPFLAELPKPDVSPIKRGGKK